MGHRSTSEFRVPGSAFWRLGFTLLELMLAVAILSVVATVTYLTFSTVVNAWQRGMELSDSLHHGDFVVHQLVMGLRSAMYPDSKEVPKLYGFQHQDVGFRADAADTISWVKLGSALVGKNCPYAGSPHRVEFSVMEDESGEPRVAVRSWQLHGQPEDFEPEDVEPLFLPSRITGFDCRAAYRKVDDEIDWLDEWDETNKLPTVVEITLYMEPIEEGGAPIEIKRRVGIPTAALCWRK